MSATARRTALLLALACVFTSPFTLRAGAADDGPNDPATADRAAITALNERWVEAYRGGDYAAIPPLYTEDALIMPRGRPAIEGRAALARRLGGLAAGREVEIDFDIVELEVIGDHAWLVSRFAVTYTSPDDPAASTTEHGRSLIVYRRDSDGAWRIHRDMDAPAPEPSAGAD